MKKVFDQTVRDLKREVNKKVLKVPGIEQKVLDATSNEPWGPHGTLLADIAQASRNYHECQMIMAIIWKRINDTGKNWRHVYKALTVLEYLVAHGSERVIDEIKEHAYQISTLSSFHYIDSNGRDQGNNVKKKSQSLVELVNDKERIVEVRQKAAANRDKFRSTSGGGMYRPGYGDRYDDDRYEGRYGSRDEDRNEYGRDREYNYRDEDRYGRYGEGDRYGRDYEDRSGYRDDDYQGRSRSIDGGSSRGRSADRDRDGGFDDDGQSSSRGLGRKFSEQNIGAPPTYEEALGESRSPAHSDRNGEATTASAPPESSSPPAPRAASPPVAKAASPPAPLSASPPAPLSASPSASSTFDQATTPFGSSVSPVGQDVDVVDEFDPRGPISAGPSFAAAPTTSNSAEMDLLGSLSDSFSNPLAIMPVTATTTTDADYQGGSAFAATHSVPKAVDQSFEDPFGDSPFKAVPSTETNSDPQLSSAFVVPFQANASPNAELSQAASTKAELGFGDSFSVSPYSTPSSYPPSTNSQFLPQELLNSNQETDILAGILPPSGPSSVVAPQAGFSAPVCQPTQPDASVYGGLNAPTFSTMPMAQTTSPQVPQFNTGTFYSQGGSPAPLPSNVLLQTPVGPATHIGNGSLLPQQGLEAPAVPQNASHSTAGPSPQLNSGYYFPQQNSLAPVASQVALQNPAGPAPQHGNGVLGGFPQGSPNLAVTQVGPPSSTGPLTVVQPSKDKFETKSTVWADTLSRGLVNLNISGPKTNPLADIGVDFDAINRREKRMEKQTTTPVTSTVTMGKAMGSGSGMGRAGASALRAPHNPMMGSGMGMAMARAPGSGMGMGGYGGINQPMEMGMGMGMGMNMGMNPGMAMNMGMGQGGQIRPPGGLAPGAAMPGSYNPMMGTGGYTQNPYGGGYR